MHRFSIRSDMIRNDRVEFSQAQAQQIALVLRMDAGDLVSGVWFGEAEYLIRLDNVHKRKTVGTIIESEPVRIDEFPIVLVSAITKASSMELILQKATELGVSVIIPAICDRCVARPGRVKPRWSKIVSEAAEQCERTTLPAVREPMSLERALLQDQCQLEIVCDERETRRSLTDVLVGSPRSVKIITGPEGGFTDKERQVMSDRGLTSAGCGRLIMRAETAAIAAVAAVSARWGELARPAIRCRWQ